MELRTHASCKNRSNGKGSMSRIEKDLHSTLNEQIHIASTTSENTEMLRRALPKDRPLRVCVVGAGVAGLRASDMLLQRGAHVTIYEGRERVGGRVAQRKLHGYTMDLGPNWIHGTENNPIMQLANSTGTKLYSWPERQQVFDEDGSSLDDGEVSEISEAFWGFVSDAFKYSNENSESIPAERSLFDFIESKIEERLSDEPPKVAERKRRLMTREAELWGAFIGGTIRKQSLKYFWLEECIEGGNPYVMDTYEKILEKIAKPVVERAEIHFNHTVNLIKATDNDPEYVTVETDRGTRRDFDEVIVTTPLGWLKSNSNVFQPPLPSRLSRAIDSIGYGCLDKVYISFPSAFWDKAPTNSIDGVVSSENPYTSDTTATTVPRHHAPSKSQQSHQTSVQEDRIIGADGDGENETGNISFAHWFKPTYSLDTNPQKWNLQGLNLAALPPSNSHPTLLFYIYGDCARHIASLANNSTHNSTKTSSPTDFSPDGLAIPFDKTLPPDSPVHDFFHPYISKLPNYSNSNPDCKPVSILATSWATDELAGYGSYSNFQTGLEEGDRDIEVMREGCPGRRIWLAGEHTSPFVALGTTTGAYWSGEGIARRIGMVYGMG